MGGGLNLKKKWGKVDKLEIEIKIDLQSRILNFG